MIRLTGQFVTDFRSIQVWQLPSESLAEVIPGKVVLVIAAGYNGLVCPPFVRKVMVNADQNDSLETHIKGELESDIGHRCSFPDPPGQIPGETLTCEGCIEIDQVLRVLLKMVMGMPGDEFLHGQAGDLVRALLDHEIIDRHVIRARKFQLREKQIDPVHPERELGLEFGQVGLFEAWPIADDETTMTPVQVVILLDAFSAFPTKWM